MSKFGKQLSEHSEEIIDRWYQEWKRSSHPHEDVSEELLRDSLAAQLRVIGEQLESSSPELPSEMWEIAERLHPEDRVEQSIPIEQEVLSYKILFSVVRDWIKERGIEVPFKEFGFFSEAIFELVAESMKRYSEYDAAKVREARSQYVAAVAHQMKTPITTLSMAVQLLSSNPAVETDVVDPMRRAIRRLKLLTSGLMRLERFQPGETPVHPQPFRVVDLIEEILDYHRPPAQELGVELLASVDPGLEITADPELCTDAIDNIVQNAIKYAAPGSVNVNVHVHNGNVLIEILDEGPGIDPERQKSLFKPVKPGHAGGAGIGLTIAWHSVVAQAGEIGFESEPDRGCRFWIRLPLEVAERT
ncbi:MAG: HAMP domain-containing histidine kinase [Acidobacteria bacterium]|nr:HAMP domain-containing histidine kinase [Acidobacteriota bacterium]